MKNKLKHIKLKHIWNLIIKGCSIIFELIISIWVYFWEMLSQKTIREGIKEYPIPSLCCITIAATVGFISCLTVMFFIFCIMLGFIILLFEYVPWLPCTVIGIYLALYLLYYFLKKKIK